MKQTKRKFFWILAALGISSCWKKDDAPPQSPPIKQEAPSSSNSKESILDPEYGPNGPESIEDEGKAYSDPLPPASEGSPYNQSVPPPHSTDKK